MSFETDFTNASGPIYGSPCAVDHRVRITWTHVRYRNSIKNVQEKARLMSSDFALLKFMYTECLWLGSHENLKQM